MKRRTLMIICCTLFVLVVIGNDQAEAGTIQPAVIAGPNIASDVLPVASKKRRSKKSHGGQYSGRISHAEALEICRKKYGWSNVARVTIRKNGSFICHEPAVNW